MLIALLATERSSWSVGQATVPAKAHSVTEFENSSNASDMEVNVISSEESTESQTSSIVCGNKDEEGERIGVIAKAC